MRIFFCLSHTLWQTIVWFVQILCLHQWNGKQMFESYAFNTREFHWYWLVSLFVSIVKHQFVIIPRCQKSTTTCLFYSFFLYFSHFSSYYFWTNFEILPSSFDSVVDFCFTFIHSIKIFMKIRFMKILFCSCYWCCSYRVSKANNPTNVYGS